MFDVSFSEILFIAVIALIVIGPEKLPKVARTLGLLAGRMQRYVATVKADVEREIQLDELRKVEQAAQNIGNTVQSGVMSEVQRFDQSLGGAASSVGQADKPSSPDKLSS